MNFYSSLVCIEVVLCLAVISTALQKLHKCVTKNTTELLFKKREEKKMFSDSKGTRYATTVFTQLSFQIWAQATFQPLLEPQKFKDDSSLNQ